VADAAGAAAGWLATRGLTGAYAAESGSMSS
jgi:hypothetical protein